MRTYTPKPRDIERRWYVIDASGAVLGRLATEVASILRGKHKPIFAPHVDTGDHVIVVNAKGVQLTGGKEEKKMAYRHSGYPGGLTATSYARLLASKPHYAVEKAVRGMLPKNSLGRSMFRKLQVYPGPDHPHQAQRPEPLKLGEIPRWEGLPKPKPVAARKAETAEKPAPKRTAAKRSTAKTPTAKAATAKRTSAKPAAKSAAKKTTAKKTNAKKSTAKRATTRRKKEE